MSEFDAYLSLAEESDDHRWAFGTGFADPLAGVDAAVPAGVDPAALAADCLALADDALIYSHRLQQWLTRAPELEEETALANIALDLLGQARMLLNRAGQAESQAAGGTGRDEDQLAFFRDEREFRNVQLVERADADFAELVGRLLIFSAWRLALLRRLSASAMPVAPDPVLAAIAERAVKELTYHRDYAAGWVIRLGDGTDFSRARMQAALFTLWPLAGELFMSPIPGLPGAAVDEAELRGEFDAVLAAVLAAATLERPDVAPRARVAGKAGRDGVHTEAMGYILAELQSVARAHPGAAW